MITVIIPTKQYKELIDAKLRYEYLRQVFDKDFFSSPPTRSGKEIVRALRDTKKYNTRFLKSIEKGLQRSSYFRA